MSAIIWVLVCYRNWVALLRRVVTRRTTKSVLFFIYNVNSFSLTTVSNFDMGPSTEQTFLELEDIDSILYIKKRSGGNRNCNWLLHITKYTSFLSADFFYGPPPQNEITQPETGTSRRPFCWSSTPNPPTSKMLV
jgi:hypothetical protein